MCIRDRSSIDTQCFVCTGKAILQKQNHLVCVLPMRQEQGSQIKFEPEIVGVLMQQFFAETGGFRGSAAFQQSPVFMQQPLGFPVCQLRLELSLIHI